MILGAALISYPLDILIAEIFPKITCLGLYPSTNNTYSTGFVCTHFILLTSANLIFQTLHGHLNRVSCLDSDPRFLVTGSHDRLVKVLHCLQQRWAG